MNVKIAELAEIALRMSREDTRKSAEAWIDHLKRWDSDPYIRQHSKKLDNSGENVYALITSDDLVVFYALEEEGITVLDVARRSAISSFSPMWEASPG